MANVYRRTNGSYCIRVSNGCKNGRQIVVSTTYHPLPNSSEATARRAAEKYAVLFEQLVHSGGYSPGVSAAEVMNPRRGISVREFIETEYYSAAELRLSPNTVRTYRTIIEQFIIPSFGELQISEIKSSHVQSFVDFLGTREARVDTRKSRTLSPATIKRYTTVLASILTEAWRKNLIDENPIGKKYIHYPRIDPPPLEAYSDSETLAFVEALNDEPPRTRAMLLLAITAGIRRGELVALKWSDIDFLDESIRIFRSVYKPKGQPEQLKNTKTVSSVRTIYFSAALGKALCEWKNEQRDQFNLVKKPQSENDFVFTDELGGLMSLYLPTKICSDFEEKHGLRHLKLHGLRHTCGSLMAAHGVDTETIKTMLGHSSLKTTNRYLHPYEASMRKASLTMNNLIKGDLNGNYPSQNNTTNS